MVKAALVLVHVRSVGRRYFLSLRLTAIMNGVCAVTLVAPRVSILNKGLVGVAAALLHSAFKFVTMLNVLDFVASPVVVGRLDRLARVATHANTSNVTNVTVLVGALNVGSFLNQISLPWIVKLIVLLLKRLLNKLVF